MDVADTVLRSRQGRGFSLLESVISVAILSVILLSMSSFMLSQTRIEVEEQSSTSIQTHLRRTISELVFELEESRPVLISVDGKRYGHCMPLKHADGRLILDGPEADSHYGIPEKSSPSAWESAEYDGTHGTKKNNYFELVFRPRTVTNDGVQVRPTPRDSRQLLSEGVIGEDLNEDGDEGDQVEGFAESMLGQDLNRDGDLLDIWVYGNMEQRRLDVGTVRWTGGRFAIPFGGKVFSLEAETVTPPYADTDRTLHSVFKEGTNSLEDRNGNGKWDASIQIMVWFLDAQDAALRLKVARARVTLRNTE